MHDATTCEWCGAEPVPLSCLWTRDDTAQWQTSCGQAFVFEDGGAPSAHKFRYCGFCGGKITEVDRDDA